ncbi:MAG: tetratricopeptide repeat protein [Candidatus Thorarchaeota archaeon]|jgi:tetratricopeptide (TPR) repeat protein
MNANEAFELGRQEMASGRLEKAIEAFDKATNLAPSSFDAWWSLASSCNLFGTQLEAEGDYKRANMYKIKAAYSFDRATRAESSNPKADKARAYAQTIRDAQARKKDRGYF